MPGMTYGMRKVKREEYHEICSACDKSLSKQKKIVVYYCKHDFGYTETYICNACNKKKKIPNISYDLHDAFHEFYELNRKGWFFSNGKLKQYLKKHKVKL